jgi:prepilin-type processing-associated H-X9-DG protein
MAIASLVLGILGFCTGGASGLVGLILGIIALVAIGNAKGMLTGKGLAIAGVTVSGVSILMVPLLVAMLLPALSSAKNAAQKVTCEANMKQVAISFGMYANDNNGKYPTCSRWCDLLIDNAGLGHKTLICPAGGSTQCSYAMNVNAAALGSNAPADMVLLFESTSGPNQCGGPELLNRNAHRNGCNIAFCDMHVEFVKEDRLPSLRWTADQQEPIKSEAP